VEGRELELILQRRPLNLHPNDMFVLQILHLNTVQENQHLMALVCSYAWILATSQKSALHFRPKTTRAKKSSLSDWNQDENIKSFVAENETENENKQFACFKQQHDEHVFSPVVSDNANVQRLVQKIYLVGTQS